MKEGRARKESIQIVVGSESLMVRKEVRSMLDKWVQDQVDKGSDLRWTSGTVQLMRWRKWTLNRSPHGNKKCREQRGRETWKYTVTVGLPEKGMTSTRRVNAMVTEQWYRHVLKRTSTSGSVR